MLAQSFDELLARTPRDLDCLPRGCDLHDLEPAGHRIRAYPETA
jgi:hypothetical protein